jgi:MFS family permease
MSSFLLISTFAFSSCSLAISDSMIGPFYPVVALDRGINQSISGFIFGAHGIVMFCFVPFTGKYIIPRYGPKRIAIIGMLICSLGNLMFAFVNHLNSNYIFFILSLTMRLAIAFGASLYMTSEFTMIMSIFPGRIGSIIVSLFINFVAISLFSHLLFYFLKSIPLLKGIVETAVGVGLSIGPMFGGFLYDNIGFETPFLLVSSVQLLLFGNLIWRLPSIESMKFS